MKAWRVSCTTCPWVTRSADLAVTAQAGKVHEHLKQGHTVSDVEEDGEWLR